MPEINEGGPVFPLENPRLLEDGQLFRQHAGMTRRQYLAAHAPITFDMVRVAWGKEGGPWLGQNDERASFFAAWAFLAYEWADAMLAEEAQRAEAAGHG